jgi:hypothetical protein
VIRIYSQEKDITDANGISATGLIIKAEAGETITALDVCYIKASDEKAYKLGTGISEANTAIAMMAIEGVASASIGRFVLKGTVKYASWALTGGKKVELSATPGQFAEVAE